MKPRPLKTSLLALVVLVGAILPERSSAADVAKVPAPAKKEGKGQFLNDLLPLAWQKRPNVRFNVYTEMTPEGRKRRVPTPSEPLRYFSPGGSYREIGWQIFSGEKPPPWRELEEVMRKALAAGGYEPTADDRQRPDLLIVFNFGSHSTDIALLAEDAFPLPVSAEELVPYLLGDPAALRDVVARARFIGGPRIGEELARTLRQEREHHRLNRHLDEPLFPVAPTPHPDERRPHGSPFVLLQGSDSTTSHVLELAFKTCYFVTATAYDFAGVEQKQKMPLWQTRMTVDAQGVEMAEVLRPLIINTGSFIGRETPDAVIVTKRMDREGRVDVGEATVVPDHSTTPRDAPRK